MKKFLTATVAAIAACTIGLCGCSFMSAGFGGTNGADGKDGRDGQNATAYDYYELAKMVEGQENMTIDEFLKKYLSYTKEELEEEFAPQRNANRSLLSAVSILTSFKYTVTTGSGFISKQVTYNAVYSGAGVIVDIDKDKGDAYVVTNCHVVYSDLSSSVISSDIRLYLYGQDTRGVNYKVASTEIVRGSIYDTVISDDEDYCINARVVAASIANDIALLKVTGSEVLKNSSAIAAEFEESDDVYVKEDVYAIGNPDGDGMSVTSGTITKESQIIQLNLSDRYADNTTGAYDRDYRVIGTDTAINGGNSGGGLFSSKTGKLVGIVNSKNAASNIDNMGYVLPGNIVKRLWKCMRDNYESKGSFATSTGTEYVVFPANYAAKSTGAYWDNEKNVAVIEEKVVITSNKTLSSGNEFKINDVVTHIKISGSNGAVKEDRDVTRVYHLQDTLISARAGDKIEITVLRGGSEVVVTYTATTSKIQ